MKRRLFVVILVFSMHIGNSQNYWDRWCFGYLAGLDFSSGTPISTSSSITAPGTCASIANTNGSLLFYCNGDSIWNFNHQTMANGAGMAGNTASAMTALILPKPGSNNLFYLFTCDATIGPNHYCYSIIDMNLASGTGSVIVKNIPLWQPSLNAMKLTATKHCNGQDYWIITHEGATSVFHSYLLSAAGLNTVAVVSVQGYTLAGTGRMKISPNGTKIAFGNSPSSNRYFAVHDFDNSTGAIGSNSIILTNVAQVPCGLEFSSDGTKLYATNSTALNDKIWQWDLCAGSQAAVAASVQTLTAPTGTINGANDSYGDFQLAPDGKIYISRYQQKNLAVINSPNAYGNNCNFLNVGQLLNFGTSANSLPNNPTFSLRNIGSFFTNTINCSNVQFTAPQHVQSTNGCAAIGPTILGTKWNFGDPVSAAQNTSSALNPSHVYSTGGTFTAYLVVNYPCYTDTFKQAVVIANPSPSFSITGKNSNCKNVTQTISVNNASAYTFSWTGIGSSTAVVVSPTSTTVYSVVATNTVSGCSSSKTFTINVNPCLDIFDENGESVVLLYPNPVTDGKCQIQSSQSIYRVELFDASGLMVFEMNDANITNFNLNNIGKGLYVIQLYSERATYRQKLMIE